MTKDQIEKEVISSLQKFLTSGGKTVPVITRQTRPIGDMGLNSPDGIDWVCDLDERGIIVPLRVNPFVDDNKHKARNVGEIVDLLFNICNSSEEK